MQPTFGSAEDIGSASSHCAKHSGSGFARHASTSQRSFTKAATGSAGLSSTEAEDEALCVGWIDGVRHCVDDARYKIRFAPGKPDSNWSAVNIERAQALQALGRMTHAGLASFTQRTEAKSRTASYEQQDVSFSPAEIKRIRSHKAAWTCFETLPPSYRKKITWWIINAKQPETRERRLLLEQANLIGESK